MDVRVYVWNSKESLYLSFECFELDDHIVNCSLGNVAGRIGTARDLIAVQLCRASECLGCLESCREVAGAGNVGAVLLLQ
jgi:hypothetical protein